MNIGKFRISGGHFGTNRMSIFTPELFKDEKNNKPFLFLNTDFNRQVQVLSFFELRRSLSLVSGSR